MTNDAYSENDHWMRVNQKGFTLIQLIVVIIILGIISTIAIVHYQDIIGHSRSSALRSNLGGIRESITIWQMDQIVKTGNETYPNCDDIMTPDEVLQFGVPTNPYQDKNKAPDSVVEGTNRGEIAGERGGYAYKSSTGEIWAKTNSDIQPTCKNPEGKLYENTW